MTPLVTILGPTACGKTAVATALAARMDGEIISADSRQVFKGMDIGTGKDLSDYEVGGMKIPYHLIDIAEAGTKYSGHRQRVPHRLCAGRSSNDSPLHGRLVGTQVQGPDKARYRW